MEDRRSLLTKSLKIAGVGLVAQFAGAAAPYVRLPGESGTLEDERSRILHEVEAINFHLLLRPAIQVMPMILATWANLDEFRKNTGSNVAGIRAKLAIMAGNNSVTLHDYNNARRWFDLAHRYARLSGNNEMVSLAHTRAANAGLYLNDSPKDLYANATLARKYATTDEACGAGYGMVARVAATLGQQKTVIRAAERAIDLATAPGVVPRIDQWSTPLAHQHISRAFARFPELAPRVESHALEALRGLPAENTVTRAHAKLNIAEVRVGARQYDGAAEVIMEVFASLPRIELQPVLMGRIEEIATQADEQDPENGPMRSVIDRLAAGYA